MRTLLAMAVLSSLFACGDDGPLVHNPMVDRWCDDHPCAWEKHGEIGQVGTWNDDDYGVSFDSDDAALTQLNANVTAAQADCYDFTMIAKLDASTRLLLELDFLDDGKVEFSERVAPSDWDRRTFLITTPTWYHGVRFVIRKEGPGKAALAQLSAMPSKQCTRPPLELLDRPTAARCESDAQCKIGSCRLVGASGFCASCADNAECADGELCGLVRGGEGTVRSCVAEASSAFGDRCSEDAQCASGICCAGACSTCCDDAPCAGGLACGSPVSWPELSESERIDWPRMCAPGAGLGVAGDVCTGPDDCASGDCEGAELGCADSCDDQECLVCVRPRPIGGACQ